MSSVFKEIISQVFTLPSGHLLEYSIGETVYLKTDKDQKQRLVTQILLGPFSSVKYALACDTTETWHYGLEISSERDVIMVTSN